MSLLTRNFMELAIVQDENGNNALQVTADNGSVQVFSKAQVDNILANTEQDKINIAAGTSQTDPELNAQALIDLATMETFCETNAIVL